MRWRARVGGGGAINVDSSRYRNHIHESLPPYCMPVDPRTLCRASSSFVLTVTALYALDPSCILLPDTLHDFFSLVAPSKALSLPPRAVKKIATLPT